MQNHIDQVEYKGIIDKFIYQKDEYKIGILLSVNGKVTFKGTLYGVTKGQEVILKGRWVNDQKYGKQLQISSWEKPIPKTAKELIAFLTSKYIKGCGVKQAERIIESLGSNAIEIILKEKESSLLKVKGIRKKRAKQIYESIKESFSLQRTIEELSKIGLSPEIAIKLFTIYSDETVKVIKGNPFLLVHHKILKFPEADDISRKLVMYPLTGLRIEAAINYLLDENCAKYGHCYISETELVNKAISLLNNKKNDFINEQSVLQSIYSLEDQSIVIEENRVYPKKFYDYEEKAAVKLISLLNSKKKVFNNEVKLNNHIKEYQLKNKVILSEEQKQAIKAVLNNKVMILTGNAGTGKTTVLKAIIHIYQQVYPKDKISLSAPTGRASRRMKEVTQHEATTNHRLLGYNQGLTNIEFEYNSSNQLKYDFLIIDEMSMVDLHLFHALLQAINPHARVLFTGDADQLPSINPGNVLLDLIKSKLPCIRLREVFRQAKESQIITNANRVNKGKSIEIDQTKDDMYFIQRANDMSIANTLIKSAVRFIEKGYSISDLLILTPMKNGEIGTYRMNSRLQDILNPYSINKNEVKQGNKIFREGDKVIQTINRPEDGVFNGDIGIITHIGSNTKGDNGNREIDIISCDYQGIQVTYKKDEWREIELGYSITIHKSQGGQAPIVLIPMSMAHYNMLIRNLIYTGMTRAEEKLIFIGDMNALNKGINTNRIIERRTTLANKIQKNIEKLTEFHKKRSKNIENVL